MNSRIHGRLMRRSTLALTLLAATASPLAWADPSCVDSDGNVINPPPSTDQGSEHGDNNTTCNYSANAYGYMNNASGDGSTATGFMNAAGGAFSTAIGAANAASGDTSNALGALNRAAGDFSTAVGYSNRATGHQGVAMGYENRSENERSTALGHSNEAYAYESTAVGAGNQAYGYRSTAVGYSNETYDVENTAVGHSNAAYGRGSTAMGNTSASHGDYSTAMGFWSMTTGERSTALGYRGHAFGQGSLVVSSWYDRNGDGTFNEDVDLDGDGVNDASSESALAAGTSAVAVGAGVQAYGDFSAAFGVDARADAEYSTALGYGAVADRGYTVSVGSDDQKLQVVNMADGTEDHDAVNVRQLRSVVDWMGAGASFAGGVFTAPVFVIQSNSYNTIGAAFAAVDAELTDINTRIGNVGGIQGERGYSAYEIAVQNGFTGTEGEWLGSLVGPQGPQGPQGPEGPAGGGPRAVVYDGDGGDTLTLAGADGTQVRNVADAVDAMDAVNLRQMQAGDAATLNAANGYTDSRETAIRSDMAAGDAATLSAANAYTDSRFSAWDAQFDNLQRNIDQRLHAQDRRIDRQGALAGAFAGMAMNTSGLSGRNRLGVGVGAQGGEQALAVGYQRAIGNRASVSLGGAFSGSERSLMGGAGFSW